ncbi:MAG TPA: T9SS type A sorting domain-containing protein [Flavipsychrobacter sp.]|nr:T9SS type A sorting domain-containing protein [Flavipsychrobacter sp.]
MKQLISAFILCILISFHAPAQTVYLADTAFVTDIGYGGAPASCKTNGMVYNSVSMNRRQGIWVADVFTVPAGATWVFDTVIVYGYQYGSDIFSPFTGCNLQIYSGTPGSGGTVVWGDTTTNVLNNSDFTGIYKVDTFSSDGGLMSTQRPIMYLKLYLSPAPSLSAGTYWLSWSATCATTSPSPATPYKVLPGRVNPPGQMSRIFADGSWEYIVDSGNNVGLNMMIIGRAGLAVAPIQNYNSENTLGQNAPNPFSNTTVISYSLAESGNVKLVVYNILGQIVATLADRNMSKGKHEVTFNASDLPGGAYYYKLSTAGGTISKQMILLK